MAANQQVEAIVLQEALGHVNTEGDADPALAGRTPAARLRVAPQQLAHEALLRRLPAVPATSATPSSCSKIMPLLGIRESSPRPHCLMQLLSWKKSHKARVNV
jgi:hypothetical protein